MQVRSEHKQTGATLRRVWCAGLSEDGGLGLGTMGWDESVARQMTADVGFTRFEVLNFEHPLNNTYWIQT